MLQKALHDQEAVPFAEFVDCFRQQAYLLKVQRCVERGGERVHSDDVGHDGVAALRPALRDEGR